MADATAASDGVDQRPWQEMDDDELISFAIEQDKKKRELTDELAPVEDKLSAMQERLVEIFEKRGDQSITRHGMTLYMRRDLWLYPDGDKAAAAEALKEAELADFVKEDFNVQSVSAYAREVEKDVATEERPHNPEAILERHPELRGKLKPTEKYKVVIIKGKG